MKYVVLNMFLLFIVEATYSSHLQTCYSINWQVREWETHRERNAHVVMYNL